jgi:hypothetical protein
MAPMTVKYLFFFVHGERRRFFGVERTEAAILTTYTAKLNSRTPDNFQNARLSSCHVAPSPLSLLVDSRLIRCNPPHMLPQLIQIDPESPGAKAIERDAVFSDEQSKKSLAYAECFCRRCNWYQHAVTKAQKGKKGLGR